MKNNAMYMQQYREKFNIMVISMIAKTWIWVLVEQESGRYSPKFSLNLEDTLLSYLE